jgi:hypothetical protein
VVAEGETLQVLDCLDRLVVVAAVALILFQWGTEQRHKAIAVVLVQPVLVMVVVVAAAQAQSVLLALVVVVVVVVMALRPQ